MNLWSGDIMEKMGAAQWIVDAWAAHSVAKENCLSQWCLPSGKDKLSKPDKVSRAGVQVVKWVSKGYAWWKGEKQQEKVGEQVSEGTIEAKGLHDYSNAEIKLMMGRMATLLKGASKLFLVMEAAENTDDQQIKAVSRLGLPWGSCSRPLRSVLKRCWTRSSTSRA